jgi:hypothetical protein
MKISEFVAVFCYSIHGMNTNALIFSFNIPSTRSL